MKNRWAAPPIRIFVFLLLGAIVNVAVAWGFCRHPWNGHVVRDGGSSGEDTAWWGSRAPPFIPRDAPALAAAEIQWFARRELVMGDEWGAVRGTHTRAGWPMFALEWEYWRSETSGQSIGTLEPGDDIMSSRPICPGFVINTVFYAAVLWLLFAAPFALRRRRRIKRGLCPACGYQWGAGTSPVCTECGHRVMRQPGAGRSTSNIEATTK